MQVPWTLSKYGSIDLPEAGQAQANMIMTQDRFDPSGEVNVEVLTNVQYFWMPYWQNHPVPSSIELRCDGRKNETVVLSDPSRIKSAGRNATFSFKQWTHSSTEDVMESGTKIKCSVELTSPGCVRDGRNTNYRADGVVERSGEGCPDIAWLAEGISWQLGIKYASETSAPVPVGGCLMVPVTTITSEWILETAATLRQLLQLIEKALQQPLLAFSMMSKTRIEWYRIEVWVIKGPKDSREFETAIRRVTKPSSQSHYPPMEDQETLANGRFQAFLDAIKSHPQQPTVSRVIDFLVGAWMPRSVAEGLVLAHAALETAIGVLDAQSSRNRMGSSQWKRLQRLVTRAVHEHAVAEQWTDEILSSVNEKIPELRRSPIINSITYHIREARIPFLDIWESEAIMEADIRAAYSARNRLFHDAETPHESDELKRWERICYLSERLIMSALGFKGAIVGPQTDE